MSTVAPGTLRPGEPAEPVEHVGGGDGSMRRWLMHGMSEPGAQHLGPHGTPPEDVSSITAGLLASGSQRLSVFPVRPAPVT